jgi:tight adherence protein B
MALALPYLYVQRLRTTRLRKFEEQFPDAVDLIARAMRAGHGLTTALGMVTEELGAPAGREFRLLYDWQNYGMSLPEALHRFADRVPLLDARFFVTSVLTQREVGGNLSEVLDNLSKMIRERFRVKRQIQVISAHGRMTGLVLGGIPPLLAVYFMIFRPGYLGELVSDPLGVRMLIGGIGLQILGVLIIRKLVDIEY